MGVPCGSRPSNSRSAALVPLFAGRSRPACGAISAAGNEASTSRAEPDDGDADRCTSRDASRGRANRDRPSHGPGRPRLFSRIPRPLRLPWKGARVPLLLPSNQSHHAQLRRRRRHQLRRRERSGGPSAHLPQSERRRLKSRPRGLVPPPGAAQRKRAAQPPSSCRGFPKNERLCLALCDDGRRCRRRRRFALADKGAHAPPISASAVSANTIFFIARPLVASSGRLEARLLKGLVRKSHSYKTKQPGRSRAAWF
jgi:hypothetical protein